MPEFTYNTCGPFTIKNSKIRKKPQKTVDSRYIYQSQLDKACFQYDIVYGDFKDLPRRTAFDKVLHNKAFNISKNLKYDGYQKGLASRVYRVFDEKSSGGGVKSENRARIRARISWRITQTNYQKT